MAKKIKAAGQPQTTEQWIVSMMEKYREPVQSFLNLLSHHGYQTLGHAFGKIAQAFAAIDIFLNANKVSITEAEAKNLEVLKDALEMAFERSERICQELAL